MVSQVAAPWYRRPAGRIPQEYVIRVLLPERCAAQAPQIAGRLDGTPQQLHTLLGNCDVVGGLAGPVANEVVQAPALCAGAAMFPLRLRLAGHPPALPRMRA